MKDLNLYIVDEVLENISKLDRALSSEQNDVFLIGKSGIGRRSLVNVMAHMLQMGVFTINVTKTYGKKEWNRDLKQVLLLTGIEKRATVFFIEDHHLKEHFVETINSLLSGEVPGLYVNEELEPLLAPLKEEFGEYQNKG